MTHPFVLVLYGPDSVNYAYGLAKGLVSFNAIPVDITTTGGRTRFGMGAICVVVWDAESASNAEFQSTLADALSSKSKSVLVCQRGDFAPPSFLGGGQLLKSGGSAAVDIGRVRELVQAMSIDSEAASQATAAPVASRGLATRSAWGVAATLAVVGVAAPAIGGHAIVRDNPPNEPRTAAPVGARRSAPSDVAGVIEAATPLSRAASAAPEREAPITTNSGAASDPNEPLDARKREFAGNADGELFWIIAEASPGDIKVQDSAGSAGANPTEYSEPSKGDL